ncbi:hypothetical protein HSBAA_13770 [Vreelandella sulfidaeris]|uniref:Uncharacterized protein n=1 Tax=Vreelandella sulfidaeris TaxID=115553 RepID=A0A455U6H5_9GAMM|nr:hypothetical protein HSBAA_13770 [Halomonas sulfidaeris]
MYSSSIAYIKNTAHKDSGMQHDALYYPSASRRMATFGKRGMVATSQPLAAQVGIRILQQGGKCD